MTEPLDINEYVRMQAERDARWRVMMDGIDVETALERNALKLIIGALAQDAQEAGDALVRVDPQQFGQVAQLQAIVRVARTVRLSLQTVIDSGKAAEMSLAQESPQEMNPV